MRISDALRRTHEVHELTAAARRSLGVPDVDASLQFLSVRMIDAVYGSPESAALLADQAFEIAANIGNAEMALRVNGHRKLHRSGHRKLHTWRR